MIEVPGVIRESVRAVLAARGFAIATTELLSGPPYVAYHALPGDQLEDVLRDVANVATKSLYSLSHESAPPATPPATSPAGGADIERDGADVVPQTSVPSRSDLLTELVALSKHAQQAHAIARELGDGAVMTLLRRIGWHAADAVARVGRALERFNRRAS